MKKKYTLALGLIVLASVLQAQEVIYQTPTLSDYGWGAVNGSHGDYLVVTRNSYQDGWQGSVNVYRIESGQEIFSRSAPMYLSANAFDMDDDAGDELVMHGYNATGSSGFVELIDLESGQSQWSEAFAGRVSAYPTLHTQSDPCDEICSPKYDLLINVTLQNASGYARLVRFFDPSVALSDGGETAKPHSLQLSSPYPNPFNPRTHIEYSLSQASETRLEIYDLLGRCIQTYPLGTQNAGSHVAMWDGRGASGQAASSGMYVMRVIAGDFSQERKVTLLR
jgi:hypothetical protein